MEVYDWWEGTDPVQQTGYLTDLITQQATQFIAEHARSPFFLYVAHGAVHTPLQSADSPPQRGPAAVRDRPSAQESQETVKRMMESLDESVGAILDAVTEAGIAERTLVWFFSDNGGAKHMRCDPLRGHKGTLWEGGHRVPAIAWWPGKIEPGSSLKPTAISLDVMPTVLDLADVSVPAGHRLDGISLASVLVEGHEIGSRQLFWNGRAMATARGNWSISTGSICCSIWTMTWARPSIWPRPIPSEFVRCWPHSTRGNTMWNKTPRTNPMSPQGNSLIVQRRGESLLNSSRADKVAELGRPNGNMIRGGSSNRGLVEAYSQISMR